jgi:hypothetical protein
VVVNGVALDEDFLPEGTVNHKYAEITVPEDRLWVLGDNRANSEDSHAHTGEPGGGFVKVDDVVGKVWAIVWPRQHLDIVDRPRSTSNRSWTRRAVAERSSRRSHRRATRIARDLAAICVLAALASVLVGPTSCSRSRFRQARWSRPSGPMSGSW